MIAPQKLEDLIREKVPFGQQDARGFYSLKCQCCNDYKVRAGFKFDGGNIIYNCWNCSTTSVFEEFSGKISKKMRGVLNAYGIDDTEISSIINSAFFIQKKDDATITLATLKKINTTTPAVQLPEKARLLGSSLDDLDYQLSLVEYLEARKIDYSKYPFYFSLEPRFLNRIIIPFFRAGKIIYWQARSILKDEKKRYDNAPVGRDAVIFNIDALSSYSAAPMFVTEGVFDAMSFDGVAILGSKLTDAKIELLRKANRRLIFVIDKDENGRHLAAKVLSEGWQIAFVPRGADDLNDCVRKFGKTWTAYHLMKNMPMDVDAARLAINVNCG